MSVSNLEKIQYARQLLIEARDSIDGNVPGHDAAIGFVDDAIDALYHAEQEMDG